MQAGANFKHTLELTFQQQIFMIFIVDYFCKKEFLNFKFFKFVDNPFKVVKCFQCLNNILFTSEIRKAINIPHTTQISSFKYVFYVIFKNIHQYNNLLHIENKPL